MVRCYLPAILSSFTSPMVPRHYLHLAGRILVAPFALTFALSLSILVKILMIVSVLASSPLTLMKTIGEGASLTPQATAIQEVSGLYGPGAYTAWVLCTVSAIIGSATNDDSSLMLSPDQITSFLYSTGSLYWSYCHALRYQPEYRDFIQDPSVQAASFVFNVSALLHGIGLVFSTERKREIWRFFVVWDAWLCLTSPISFIDGPSFLMQIMGLGTSIFSILPTLFPEKPSPWVFSFLLLMPFIALEATRLQFSDGLINFIPKTTSSLTDLDQLITLVTAVVLLVYQWRIWDLRPIYDRLRGRSRRTPIRGYLILKGTLPLAYNRSTTRKYLNTR
jgi:hypothetical protein